MHPYILPTTLSDPFCSTTIKSDHVAFLFGRRPIYMKLQFQYKYTTHKIMKPLKIVYTIYKENNMLQLFWDDFFSKLPSTFNTNNTYNK